MMCICLGNMFVVSLLFEIFFKIFNLIMKFIYNMNYNIIKDEVWWFIKFFFLILKYLKFYNVRRILLICKGWNVKIININNKNNLKKWNLKKFV